MCGGARLNCRICMICTSALAPPFAKNCGIKWNMQILINKPPILNGPISVWLCQVVNHCIVDVSFSLRSPLLPCIWSMRICVCVWLLSSLKKMHRFGSWNAQCSAQHAITRLFVRTMRHSHESDVWSRQWTLATYWIDFNRPIKNPQRCTRNKWIFKCQ